MKLSTLTLILTLILATAAFNAQAQTENIGRHKRSSTSAAKPAVKSEARPTASKIPKFKYEITGTKTCEVAGVDNARGAVTIPSTATINGRTYTVTAIGHSAFSNCEALTSINIPSSVTSIGGWAFCWCTALTCIDIPNSVTDIDCCAFEGCKSLPVIDNVRYAGNCAIDVVDNSCSNYTIQSGTRLIGHGAFAYCQVLTSIDIPNSVSIIEDLAFWNCSALTNIDIPSNVTYIGDKAFESCEVLIDVNCYTKTPPAANEYGPCFPSGVTLHVPQGCAQAYRRAKYWQDYRIVDDL